MGGFGDAEEVTGAAATDYYTGQAGLNFGGYCQAAGCAAAGQAVSYCEGMFTGSPYDLAGVTTKCPACTRTFKPGWLWLAQCNVVISKEGGDENFTLSAGKLRKVDLKLDPTTQEYSYEGESSDLAVTPL